MAQPGCGEMKRGLAFFDIRFSGNLTIMNAHTDGLRDDTRLEMINAEMINA